MKEQNKEELSWGSVDQKALEAVLIPWLPTIYTQRTLVWPRHAFQSKQNDDSHVILTLLNYDMDALEDRIQV